ncbi:RidA family protein [Lacrimispora aerotolerans]|jgi:2-iminobutanoate/2-iminopropanoate deaminase|uniref:RidA family protein n=1 Tax=Lacrimispora aerotolerans TaxID=36832 RepID=UPI000479E145|nr:RidA family protein [Lacrimispora aerotolerans]
MKKVLATENAPAAIGPYSQGMRCGDMVFISGQLPIDPTTGVFAGEDIASQTRQALTNIRAILKSDGLTMANIVKTTVLLKNISDFSAMNEVYAEFFEGAYPARAAFEVAALPKDSLIEIEAVAYLGE